MLRGMVMVGREKEKLDNLERKLSEKERENKR